MPKSKNQKMTMDRLAQMTQREFLSVEKRFDSVDENIALLRRDTESGFGALGEVLKAIREDVKDIKSDVATINLDYIEFRTRIE